MKSVKFRYIFCVLVLFLSLMFLGSAKISGEQKSRSRRALNVSICRNTCADMSLYVPPEERAAWDQLVADAPELALKSMTLNLHELPRPR